MPHVLHFFSGIIRSKKYGQDGSLRLREASLFRRCSAEAFPPLFHSTTAQPPRIPNLTTTYCTQ